MKILAFTLGLLGSAVLSYADEVKPKIDVLHIWKTPEERHALNVFRDVLVHEGVEWSDGAPKVRRINLQDTIADMVAIGAAPGAFQFYTSNTSIAKLYESGLAVPIGNIDVGYAEKLIPQLKNNTSVGDEAFLLPLGIHTYNFMIYNKEIMDRYGLKQAETWDEFISYGEVLKKDGIYLLSSSNQFWQIRTLTRAVLASFFTQEEFLELLNDDRETDLETFGPALEGAFSVISKLKAYSMPDSENLPWNEASKRVREGKALTQILGDYILPQFPDRDNIVCSTTPESKFISWGFDSFAFMETDDPNVIAGQAALVRAATDPKNLVEYLYRKGGLPVLKGIEVEDLDDCNAVNFQSWKTMETLDTNLLSSNSYLTIFTAMASFWDTSEDISPVDAMRRTLEVLGEL